MPLCMLFGEGNGNYGVKAEITVPNEQREVFIVKLDLALSITSHNIAVVTSNDAQQ